MARIASKSFEVTSSIAAGVELFGTNYGKMGFNSCEACTVYLFRGGSAAHDETLLTRYTCLRADVIASLLCGCHDDHGAPFRALGATEP